MLASASVRVGSSVSNAAQRNGYEIIPLLTPAECLDLLEIFDSLRERTDLGPGFHVSMYSSDRGYRAEADEVVRAALAPKMASRLSGFDALVGNFVVKQPGSTAGVVPVHQDWTFVDERRFASLSVWCPLADVTPHNGTLHVLAGSHKLANFLRGPGVPVPFHGLEPAIRERGTALSLPAGHAVIYHHRLIHWSPANTSSTPRVAVNLLLTPKDVGLCHVRGDRAGDDGLLDMYEVKRSYFLNYRPWEPPTDTCRVGRLSAATHGLTEHQLDQICNQQF